MKLSNLTSLAKNAVTTPFGILALILLGAILLAFIYAKLNSRSGAKLALVREEVLATPGADELIVVVHGYVSDKNTMTEVGEAALEARTESGHKADLMMIEYSAQRFSNANCYLLSEAICEKIDQLYSENQYERIFLVGHSLGALLLRKAYCYGHGKVVDLHDQAATREKQDWVDQVDRFFLFAGMNRGYPAKSEDYPDAMNWYTSALIPVGHWVANRTGTGKLIQQIEAGAPFVANLRIQWIELMTHLEDKEESVPVVVQMLGTDDELVNESDSKDVAVARNFIWVKVAGTNHANAVRLTGDAHAAVRRKKFLLGMGTESDVEKLRRLSPVSPDDRDLEVTEIVIVLHGIRDMGHWTSQFEFPLKNEFEKRADVQEKGKIHIHNPSYQRLGMGPFLLWADRQERVRWFMDEYTDLRARFPNAKKVHYVGHSNGTYVVASALENYQTLKVNRVVLANSVLPRSFNWRRFKGRIDSVRNYTGSNDWVVGLFPRLFEFDFIPWNKDLGSAGFNGFSTDFGSDKETRFLKGGHGAGVSPENIESIVSYVISDKVEDSPLKTLEQNGTTKLLSNIAWLVWIGIIVVVVAAGFGAVFCGEFFSGHLSVLAERAVRGAAFILLLWLTLKTV